MNLQVLPLKVLVSRVVVRNKMDYSTFLNGTLKEELDRLDWLAGEFRIQASKLVIEASFEGIKSSDDIQKMITKFMPEGLIDIIDGMAKLLKK